MNRICMLSTGHDPLDDRIYYKEALSLAKRHPAITIVAQGAPTKRENGCGIEFRSLGQAKSLLGRVLLIPRAVLATARLRPSVCHFHDYELIFAIPLLKLFSRRVIYDAHELNFETALESGKIPRLFRRPFSRLVDKAEKTLSGLADYVIASDQSIAEGFDERKTPVETIFNYPRLALFKPDEERLRSLRNVYRGRTPILYQGSMGEERGLFVMIRAMEIVRASRPDVVLLLVGPMDGGLKRSAEDLVSEKRLEDCVQIIGPVPHKDVVNFIAVSRVGLVPLLPTKKFMKNIPIKQFEYMACGVPVLGADLPPIASYVNESRTGLTFDSTSPDALAKGVLAILENEREWKKMSDAGKRAVQDRWNWDEMEKRLLRVYEQVAGTGRKNEVDSVENSRT